jgi:hypothetical protein
MSLTLNAGEAETVGEPDEGKLHARIDEGRLGTDRLRGLWRPTRRWVTAGECSSALNAVPHQPPTPQRISGPWHLMPTTLGGTFSSSTDQLHSRVICIPTG